MSAEREALPVPGRDWREGLRTRAGLASIVTVLVVLVVLFAVMTPYFIVPGNLSDIARQVAPELVIAVVSTFVITTGGIDLSVGSVVALIGSLSALALAAHWPFLVVLLAMLGLGGFVGALNGYFIAYQGIPPFIVTLASLSFVEGTALAITSGYSIPIPMSSPFVAMGQGNLGLVPAPAVIALVLLLAGAVGLNRTRFGQYVVGIGSNEEAVRRAGVDTRSVKFSVYILSSMSAAVAGMIIAARLATGSADTGLTLNLDVIAAVVLGGTDLFGGYGTILGTLVGTLIIGVVGNGLILLHVPAFYTQIFQGGIILLALWGNKRLVTYTESRRSAR